MFSFIKRFDDSFRLILNRDRRIIIILSAWFYLAAIADLTISVLGFLSIGIGFEKNPKVVDAWNSDFLAFVVSYFLVHIWYLIIFLYLLLIIKYIELTFDSKLMLVLQIIVILTLAFFAYLAVEHWNQSCIWIVNILTNGYITNSQYGVPLYLFFISIHYLIYFVLLRKYFRNRYSLETLIE